VPDEYLRTWIGSSTPDRIMIGGRDLAADVMGNMTLTQLAFLLLTRHAPTPGQTRMLDAVLVSLADHGLTPSALAARLTYTGAPESVQGAVAAGLLGAGSVFLGPAGDTALFLAEAIGSAGDRPDLAALAVRLVTARRRAGQRIPGIGHPVHKDADPRTARLYALAAEEGLLGPHLELLGHVADAHDRQAGRHLPVNGAGAAGAALVDVGVPPGSVRGFVLIGRTAGLVAHLAEEQAEPIGMPLWLEAERRSSPE
jgi:citrate synthase